jgi:hypothetical protein
MGSSLRLGLVGIALVACSGKKDEPETGKDRRPDVPIRIAFGDCTGSAVAFESGPRPLPPQAGGGEATASAEPAAPPASAGSGFDDSHIHGGLLEDDGQSGGSGAGGGPASVPTISAGQPIVAGDRSDLEIAGADEVVYGDIVKTIELATKVGFSDWSVLPPAGLAARARP